MSDDGPDRYLGNPEKYLADVKATPRPFNPLFCATHWMPCPVEGKPGMLMSIVMQVELLGRMPEDVTAGGHTAMNSWQANLVTPLCCELGDEKMRWLWDFIDEPHCQAKPPQGHRMSGGRVCWKPPGHLPPHEWDAPGSVFDLMP